MNYSERKPDFKIDVLGTTYGVYTGITTADDDILKNCDGYFDKTAKRIVIAAPDDCDLADWEKYEHSVMRHEIVHTFLYESGHSGEMKWDVPGQEHPEHMVEWIAIMFPKLARAFSKAGCEM